MRITTVNMATEEHQELKDQQNNVKHTKKEHSNEYDQIEFNKQEESKDLKACVASKRHPDDRHSNAYKSKQIDSVIDESSVIKRSKCKHKDDQSRPNQSKLKLDAIDNINCSQSMKSVLNFNPDDVITHKKLTYRSKRSGATSNTILKTPGGYEAIGSRPLKYLKDGDRRLKSKKQLSEDHMLRMSEEMLKIMHQHHLSTGNHKYSLLNKSQPKGLDGQPDDDMLKEMSNFMEPREIISIFSMDRRHTPHVYHSNHRENAINSVQLSTLSTNPK